MRFLHTSDWHLGRTLYGKRRTGEFQSFLDWLAGLLDEKGIDVLLISGDIFDTSTPGNRAQELYYRFLCQAAATCCRHIVITAGNHDSPSFLDAPGDLLKALNIHVVGTASPDDEVLVLDDEAVVCAVPYLRDRDIRTVEPGESADEKSRKLIKGVEDHYALVTEAACEKRRVLEEDDDNTSVQKSIPLITMGHLFTQGGKTRDGDGVRELYVGSLAHVGAGAFPDEIDYLALGHLHVPQMVGGLETRRYSGSPLPMGFGEADQQKKVICVDFPDGWTKGDAPSVEAVFVPEFQALERVRGNSDEILANLEMLRMRGESVWLEIEYTGKGAAGDLKSRMEEALEGTDLEILRIKNRTAVERVLQADKEEETLDDLDEHLVFERCLDAYLEADEERDDLRASYNEILKGLYENREEREGAES